MSPGKPGEPDPQEKSRRFQVVSEWTDWVAESTYSVFLLRNRTRIDSEARHGSIDKCAENLSLSQKKVMGEISELESSSPN